MKNVFLVGPMGAGKTSIGKKLANKLNLEFYDSDQVVEKRAGVDILWIYDLEGEAGFRLREQKVIAELVQFKNILLATGGSTIAIPENRTALATNGIVVYLKTSLADQLERTSYSKKRPLAKETEERHNALKNLLNKYEPFYCEIAHIIYDTDGKTTPTIVKELANMVRNYKS